MEPYWQKILYQFRFLILTAVVLGFISGHSFLSNAGKNEQTNVVQTTPVVSTEGVSPSYTATNSPAAVTAVAFFEEEVAGIGESTQLVVQLVDSNGQALPNHILELHAKNTELVDIDSSRALTDAQGLMTFEVSSYESGILEFTIVDHTAGLVLSEQPKLVVLEGAGGPGEVSLASESGPLSGFQIEMEESVAAGDAVNVTVTAVDEDGITVTDYTGTIRFSTTDSQAELPNDYTFRAEDQGSHTFSLAVEFGTAGNQVLQVTDIDKFTISDEVEVTVTSEGTEPDDEDPDPSDDGEFQLLSPASGTYSSDTIEVLGEGEYGQGFVVYLDDEEAGTGEVDNDNSFSFTIENVKDGEHELYVELVELDDEGEVSEVLETSDIEEITIDTTPPDLVQVSYEPEDDLQAGDKVTFTILTEEGLDDVSLLLEDAIYELKETNTDGKYEVEVTLPDEEGDYTVDLVLMDQLGNEVRYRDAVTLSVGGTDTPEDPDDPKDPEAPEDPAPEAVTGLTGSAEKGGKVTLTWEPAESEENPIDHYIVYYGPEADKLFGNSETYDSSTTWYIPKLQPNQTFYFAVSAVDSEGNEGELSEVISVKTLDEEPIGGDDTRPDPTDTPPENLPSPPENPTTGPGLTLFLISAVLLGGIYSARRLVKA